MVEEIKKIVILGADGMLGTDLCGVFPDSIKLIKKDLDITKKKEVDKKIRELSPDVIINAAAYTDVEGAEINKELCFNVNVNGAVNIAKAAKETKAVLVHLSTDYVFDGEKESFNEEDSLNPLNFYGFSKAEAEKQLKDVMDKCYLIRTSWLFGKNGKNVVDTILKLSDKGPIQVVNDQRGSPTYTKDLALKIKKLVETKPPYGTYHLTNEGSCSWYEFAKEAVLIKNICLIIKPISTRECQILAKRPKSSILKNNKTEKLRSWKLALRSYLEEIK